MPALELTGVQVCATRCEHSRITDDNFSTNRKATQSKLSLRKRTCTFVHVDVHVFPTKIYISLCIRKSSEIFLINKFGDSVFNVLASRHPYFSCSGTMIIENIKLIQV